MKHEPIPRKTPKNVEFQPKLDSIVQVNTTNPVINSPIITKRLRSKAKSGEHKIFSLKSLSRKGSQIKYLNSIVPPPKWDNEFKFERNFSTMFKYLFYIYY